MARIAGVNIPQNKLVRIGLTYIFGIDNDLQISLENLSPIPYMYVSPI